jgi:hypothetical protein
MVHNATTLPQHQLLLHSWLLSYITKYLTKAPAIESPRKVHQAT